MSTGKIKQLAFSEGVTVGTPSEIAALAVGLASYASEAAFVSAEGAATVGDAFYDTGASAIKYYDGAWKTVASTAAALSNPMAATGDMIYGGASGTPTNLATGATAGLLHGGNGSTPTWSKVVNADVDASAAIAYSKLSLSNSIVRADFASGAEADASNRGVVSTGAQTFAGTKTFTGAIGVGSSAGSAALYMTARKYTGVNTSTAVNSSVVQGFAFAINDTNNQAAMFLLTEAGVYEVSDHGSAWTTDNTGSENSLYYSGGTLYLNWRGASTKNFTVFLFATSSGDVQ